MTTDKRGNVVAVVAVLAVVATVLFGLPLGVAVWVLVVVVVYAAPDPDMLEDPDTKRAEFYRKLRRSRRAVLGWCSDVWRFGPANPPKLPAPDPNEPQDMRPPAGRFGPITYVTLLAVVVMLGSVGAEVLVGNMSSSYIESVTDETTDQTTPTEPAPETTDQTTPTEPAPETTAGSPSFDNIGTWIVENNARNRNWGLAALGAIPLWVAINALASAFRFRRIKTLECVAPPAVLRPPWSYTLKKLTPALILLSVTTAAAMLMLDTPSGGWLPALLMIWGFGLAVTGSWLLKDDQVEQKADWLYRQQQIMEWRTRWWSVPVLRTRDVSEIPAYHSEANYPEPEPPPPEPDESDVMDPSSLDADDIGALLKRGGWNQSWSSSDDAADEGEAEQKPKQPSKLKSMISNAASRLWSLLPTRREEPEEPEPTHKTVAFVLQPGYKFGDYAGMGPQLAPAIGQRRVLFEPHQSSAGAPSWGVMQVTHELSDLGNNPHLNRDLDKDTAHFVTRWAIIEAFDSLKLERPLCIRSQWITQPNSRSQIRESVWMLPPGVTSDQVIAKTGALAEKLDVEWLRTWQPPGTNHLHIYFGNFPKNARFSDYAAEQAVNEADWLHHMRAAGMVGHASQLPRMLSIGTTPLGAKQIHFRLPPGLAYKTISNFNTISTLIATSGWSYIDPHEDEKDPTTFSLVIGDKDPLDDVYLFSDYRHDLLREPERGNPDIGWLVGIGSDGQPIKYDWDSEEPHLLVAGSSGSGKSGVINSCLVQMLHNNHPDDLHLWMCEPKNELQTYQHLAHVQRFLDAQVTDCSPYESAAYLLEEAVAEMNRRYAVFSLHPQAPQKLSEARHLAALDPEGSKELMLPYLVLVIEECSSYFSTPGVKADRPHHDRLYAAVMELARKSRAAGIHMLVATQYPTNVNIPQTLKQQCRRLGLQTADDLASQVIIDQSGLERIKVKGRGMITGDSGGFEHFRGFWMDRPDANRPDIPDDRMQILSALPTTTVWPKLPPTVPPSPLSIERMITLPNGARVKSHLPTPSETVGARRQAKGSTLFDMDGQTSPGQTATDWQRRGAPPLPTRPT